MPLFAQQKLGGIRQKQVRQLNIGRRKTKLEHEDLGFRNKKIKFSK